MTKKDSSKDQINALLEEYKMFTQENNLPGCSAEELIIEADLTNAQKEFLADFITRWDKAMADHYLGWLSVSAFRLVTVSRRSLSDFLVTT